MKEIEDSDGEDIRLRKKLNNCLIQENPKVKWDDIAGLEKTKQILKDTIILPVQFPQLFTGKLKPNKNILFYGPSGTGKSYLIKALLTEANIPFFSASAADIISKYIGESEKLIKNLFDLAGKETNSIIFLDQIDFILISSIDEETRKTMNELIKQMKEVEKKNKNIFVIGSTNVIPSELNPVALQLFQKKIYIGLPEFEERKLLFKINLSETKNNLNNEQLDSLTKLTEGYSGSDIYNLIQEALFEPLRKNKSDPCSKKEEGEIVESSISYEDIVRSLEIMKPSVSKNYLKKFKDFTEELGIKG